MGFDSLGLTGLGLLLMDAGELNAVISFLPNVTEVIVSQLLNELHTNKQSMSAFFLRPVKSSSEFKKVIHKYESLKTLKIDTTEKTSEFMELDDLFGGTPFSSKPIEMEIIEFIENKDFFRGKYNTFDEITMNRFTDLKEEYEKCPKDLRKLVEDFKLTYAEYQILHVLSANIYKTDKIYFDILQAKKSYNRIFNVQETYNLKGINERVKFIYGCNELLDSRTKGKAVLDQMIATIEEYIGFSNKHTPLIDDIRLQLENTDGGSTFIKEVEKFPALVLHLNEIHGIVSKGLVIPDVIDYKGFSFEDTRTFNSLSEDEKTNLALNMLNRLGICGILPKPMDEFFEGLNTLSLKKVSSGEIDATEKSMLNLFRTAMLSKRYISSR